jgi:hypothetical protein
MEFVCHPVFAENTEFLKINMFPSPHEEVLSIYSVGSDRKNSSRWNLVLIDPTEQVPSVAFLIENGNMFYF